MPLPKDCPYTAEDYWNLPDGRRAELIAGELYDMAPPSYTHQRLVGGLYYALRTYIESHAGTCEAFMAPFAVGVTGDDRNWVEPDVFVVCDPAKLSERGCEGAPDLVIEVVSPSSRRHDYIVKLGLYERAGVREYWIVDPGEKRTAVYSFEPGRRLLQTYHFCETVPVGIYDGLNIRVEDLL